jgi:hypothetical protein
VDGVAQQGNTIALVDDGRTHEVELHVASRHDDMQMDKPLNFVNKLMSN